MRSSLQALLLGLFVVAAGYLGYFLLFGRDPAVGLVVAETSGPVTRSRADGTESDAVVGMSVDPDDRIVVGPDGGALLAIGEGASVRLGSRSSVRVTAVDENGVRIELEGGRVQARVRAGAPSVGVASRGRAAVATDADFTVGVDESGALAVQAERGSVALTGLTGVESLAERSRVVAAPGSDPITLAGEEADARLLLQVEWPPAAETRDPAVALAGRTDPYAEVSIAVGGRETRVRADRDGRFSSDVPLAEGANPVEVRVRDPLGRTSQEARDLLRDSTPPGPASAEVQWDP